MSDSFIEDNPLIGESEALHVLLERVSQLAKLDKPILIIGERGTGKELIAARLHYLSERWSKEFVKLNCAALTETLLETELFGHEAGAFTGAVKRHIGRFERAAEGTLFLDEIANTPARLQEKILRVIEYGEFERVGSSRTQTSNARIIAAANVDLPSLAGRGQFRHDLLDRISFDVLTLPPLRYRGEDILILAEHFAVRMIKDLKLGFFPGFTEEIKQQLLNYDWPGNVRELKNVIERAVYRCAGQKIIDRIQIDPFESPYRPGQTCQDRQADGASQNTGDPVEQTQLTAPFDLYKEVEKYEARLLSAALVTNKHHQKKTAAFLGLTYNQFRGLLKKHGQP
ncbi:MAG: phage shock protein operon transcriptional activator [Deltaproteobacteria bacterium]|nr:phage shock protein operon transcriptional activator [Deltaproteobacteria bacterium]